MGAASAQIVAERLGDLGLARARRAFEQRLCGHDHTVEAVTALRGLFGDEGILHRVGMLARAEALESDDVAADAALDRYHAGACGHIIDQHRTGPAFAQAATVFRSIQSEIVAQHVEQRGIGSGADLVTPAVDGQSYRRLRHLPPRTRCATPFATVPFVYKRASGLHSAMRAPRHPRTGVALTE